MRPAPRTSMRMREHGNLSAISMSDVPEDVPVVPVAELPSCQVADEAGDEALSVTAPPSSEIAAEEPGNLATGQPGNVEGNPVTEHAGERLVVIKHHALVRL